VKRVSETDGHRATPLASGRIQTALEKYIRGSITLPRAAELAGVSIYEMIAILEERKIPYRYDLSDLEEYVKRRR
jgi:predicted HTH domain antitoxin